MAALRWDLAEQPRPQQTLFDEPVFERQPGRGEYRDIEFLHVRAQRVVNEVKGAPFGFRYTVNPYRGCTHACSYCLDGDTPVLLADGRWRALADIRPGDVVCGTRARWGTRRCVATRVLDHWSTVRPAYRVTLAGGAELIASGDHRFLTERGWQHVAGAAGGAPARPHLAAGSRLLGVSARPAGGAATPAEAVVGGHAPGGRSPAPGARAAHGTAAAVGGDAHLRVAAVEPLGVDLPMFDITTGTGDFIANGVVSHNCFARPTHTYLGLDGDRDFERRIVVKVNAVSQLRSELDPRRWRGDLVAMGTNTDPYQRAEGKYRLTRGIVEVLAERANPFSILTKSTLILRDLDVLARAARSTDVRVNLSIGTLDEDVWRATEPGTPHPLRRVRAVEQLNAAGIETGVLVAPVLPGLSDRAEQLDAVVGACVAAGAASISPVMLHLRPGVRDIFLSRLGETHPEVVAQVRRRYRDRAHAPASEQEALAAQVRDLVHAHGGPTAGRGDPGPASGGRRGDLRAKAAEPPPTATARPRPAVADQLSLL